MMINILLILAAIVVVFVLVVAVQPADFCVTRSITIPAPPSAVFPHVNDLRKWDAWSPWAKMDPDAKVSFEGPSAGVGAVMSWASTLDKVGVGKMTITESRPDTLVGFRLDFVKPFAGTNTAEFEFKPEGNQTVVTWSMAGKKNFIAKALGLFMSCDKMVGGMFEQGLADLNAEVKAAPNH